MLSSLCRLALLATLAATAGADAQVLLHPGHPDLAVAEVTIDGAPRVARLSGHDVNTTSRTVAQADSIVTLESISELYDGSQRHRTVRFVWPSLRPLSDRVEESGEWAGEAVFDGAQVSGQFVRDARPATPFDLTLQQVPFQEETVEFVARALPLQAGYTAVAPAFSARHRLRDHALTVIGPDEVRLHDGTAVSAWAVDETVSGRGGYTRRLFVDPETRDLIAIETRLSADSGVLIEPTTQEAIAARVAEREASPPLRPGSGELAVGALQNGTRSYALRVVTPETMRQDLATLTQTWTVDAEAGTATLVTNTLATRGQRTIETVTLAYPSLQPLTETSVADGALTERVYSDGIVRETTASGSTERALETPVFGTSVALLSEVARLLPLTEGYQASYHMDSAEGVAEVTLTVDGPREIDGRRVWTVSAVPPSGLIEVAFDPETRETVRVALWPLPGMVAHITPAD